MDLIAHKRISLFGYNEEVDKHRQSAQTK